MSPSASNRIATPVLLATLFAATACGSSTPSTAPDSTPTSPPSAAASTPPDPALTKSLLDQASLPPGYTIVDPQTAAAGHAAAGAITNTSETSFTPSECGPANGKITLTPNTSATLAATTASADATLSEAVARELYNFTELRANRAKCMTYTVTAKVMGIESSVRVTSTILDSPRTAAADLLVVEERSESTNPATAAPSTSLVAYANAGKVSLMLTSSALDRSAFDSLLSTAIDRARAAG